MNQIWIRSRYSLLVPLIAVSLSIITYHTARTQGTLTLSMPYENNKAALHPNISNTVEARIQSPFVPHIIDHSNVMTVNENVGTTILTHTFENTGTQAYEANLYAMSIFCGNDSDPKLAIEDRDYNESHRAITLPPGRHTFTLSLEILDDKLVEGNEYLCLFYTINPAGSMTSESVAIHDDELPDPPLNTNAPSIYLPLITRAAYTLRCNPTRGAGGLAPGSYDTIVAGRKAMVIVGKNYKPTTPTYLVFFLHGDDGDYKFITGPGLVRDYVNERGWIMVSPLAEENGAWGDAFVEDKQALAKIFDTLMAQYNVCRDVILGSAASGGSHFWSTYFFPGKGHIYPTYMLLNCGAGTIPRTTSLLKLLGQDQESVTRTLIKYSYGTEDFLFDAIQESSQIVAAAGFSVLKNEMEGVEHCAFSIDLETYKFWNDLSPYLLPE